MNRSVIYWPNDIIVPDDKAKYVILGYRVDKNKYVIIDVKDKDVYKLCDMDKGIAKHIEVVGCINFKNKKLIKQIEGFDFSSQKPIVSKSHLVVYYKPPNSSKLEYFSLDPITINIFWNSNNTEWTDDKGMSQIQSKYKKKWMLHFPDQTAPPKTTMKDVLRIINLTNYLRYRINNEENNSSFASAWRIGGSYLEILITVLSFLYNFIIRDICLFLNRLLTKPILNIRSSSYHGYYQNKRLVSLTSLSFFIHQINVRIRQVYYLPWLFRKLKVSRMESENSIIKDSKFSPTEYIKFYNTVWIIVNDFLLGNILSGYFIENRKIISDNTHCLLPVYEQHIEHIIIWLMDSPAGFKLNNELASFLGQLIIWVLNFWKTTTLQIFSDYFDHIFYTCVCVAKYGGASMFLAIMLDIISLLSLNLQGFYIACTRLYHWQLNIIRSLFRLFYGKKYNVLRSRVDSNEYEFDQLMLGIIIFSILVYLLPTVFAFYLTFVMTQLFTLYGTLILKFLLININHFPIVVLLLKLKNNERLPAGIQFETRDNDVVLKTNSIGVREIYLSHINSMYQFNLFNMNNSHLLPIKDEQKYDTQNITENWNRVGFFNIVKRVLTGEPVVDYNYKEMF